MQWTKKIKSEDPDPSKKCNRQKKNKKGNTEIHSKKCNRQKKK